MPQNASRNDNYYILTYQIALTVYINSFKMLKDIGMEVLSIYMQQQHATILAKHVIIVAI